MKKMRPLLLIVYMFLAVLLGYGIAGAYGIEVTSDVRMVNWYWFTAGAGFVLFWEVLCPKHICQD